MSEPPGGPGPGLRDRRLDRMLPALHPGTLPRRGGLVGLALMVGLFLAFVTLGIYASVQHHGAPTAQTLEVTVNGGRMSPDHLRVHEGDQVVLSIIGDKSQTILVKGYGQRVTLIPGVRVAATFVAEKPGTFDIVLADSGEKVGQLEVTR